jgi:hypothetical protein
MLCELFINTQSADGIALLTATSYRTTRCCQSYEPCPLSSRIRKSYACATLIFLSTHFSFSSYTLYAFLGHVRYSFQLRVFFYPVLLVVIDVGYRLSVSPRTLICCFVYSRVFILSCSYHSCSSCYCSLYFMSLCPHRLCYYLFDIYYVQCEVHTNVYYLSNMPAN